MTRQEYYSSLRAAVDALEKHVESAKIFIGSPVERTAKYQELISAKKHALDLMIMELDVLCREDMRST